jgi:hypothetical protein
MSLSDRAVLLAVSGSVTVDVRVAVLLSAPTPPACRGSTWPLIVKVLTAPTGNGTAAASQVTTELATTQLPGNAGPSVLEAEATIDDTTMSPGMVSTTRTPADTDGPLLPTVMVHVTVFPAMTGSGDAVLRTHTSARCTPVAAVVDEFGSVAPIGSGVVALTAAVLESEPVNVDAKVPVMVIVVEPFSGRLAIEHVTVVVPLHDPGAVVALVSVTPAGTVSVTVMPAASDGPLFVTTSVQVTD